MLPPGHLAAGYLVSVGTAKAFGADLAPLGSPELIAFGVFMGFAPDLDMFYSFYKRKRFYFDRHWSNPEFNHRGYLSHAPLLYLLISSITFVLGYMLGYDLLQALAIMFVVGSWSHFLLDSSREGVMWLWPFSTRRLSFYHPSGEKPAEGKNFFDFWKNFVSQYAIKPEFYLELLIVAAALVVFTNS